jgi:uncharacterized protein
MNKKNALLLLLILFIQPLHSQSFFPEEFSEYEMKIFRYELNKNIEVTEEIDNLLLMMEFMDMRSGDCEYAFEIDNKARQGDLKSQWLLADLYKIGLCVPQNDQEAFEWVKKAADEGYIDAMRDVATFFMTGVGTTINIDQAKSYYLKAVEKNDGESAKLLGSIYENGDSTAQDFNQAIKFYKLSCDLGNGDGCAQGGVLLLKNIVDDNDIAAERILLDGAELNNDFSKYILSIFYSEFLLKSNDFIEAHKFANLASLSDNEDLANLAIESRVSIEKLMTTQEILQAQKRAADWKPIDQLVDDPYSIPTELPTITDRQLSVIVNESAARQLLSDLEVPIDRLVLFKSIQQNNVNLFKLFIAAGADIETTSIVSIGTTPLISAIDFGSNEIFDFLISSGANINAVTSEGMTPIIRSLAHERDYMIETLLKLGVDTSKRSQSSNSLLSPSALTYSIMTKNLDYFKKALTLGATLPEITDIGMTLLHHSVTADAIEIAKYLIDQGMDVNSADVYGRTPLHMVIENLDDASLIMAQLLINSGADLNQYPDGDELPLLYYGILNGNPQLIDLLIASGANVNQHISVYPDKTPQNASELEKSILQNGGSLAMVALSRAAVTPFRQLAENGANLKHTIAVEGTNISLSDIASETGMQNILKAVEN